MPVWMKPLLLVAGLLFAASSCFGQELDWQSPSPTPAQAAALLRAVCPGAAQAAGSAPDSLPGCKPCPKYTSVGTQEPRQGKQGSFDLDSVIYGSFTAPGVREAVAGFEGCEYHLTGGGGTVLLRKLHGSWAMIDYRAALITSACQPYHLKTGRDLLLCENVDHFQGEMVQWFYWCDFSKEAQSRSETIFEVHDTRGMSRNSALCGSIDKVLLHDLNGDGMPDLTIWFSAGKGAFPGAEGPCNSDGARAAVQKHRMDFLFEPNTESFILDPGSEALWESYREFLRQRN
jgi:hypothetical protein